MKTLLLASTALAFASTAYAADMIRPQCWEENVGGQVQRHCEVPHNNVAPRADVPPPPAAVPPPAAQAYPPPPPVRPWPTSACLYGPPPCPVYYDRAPAPFYGPQPPGYYVPPPG